MRIARAELAAKPGSGRGILARTKQKGAVMIVALMLLLVMTVLAVSGVGNSVLEQKMSGNYYHSATAFQAAEFGLRVAEQWLIKNVTIASSWETWFKTNTSNNGLYTTQETASPNSVEVCNGNIDCQFDPRDEAEWCNGGGGCDLPKGFVTLGESIEGTTPLETVDLPVAQQPRFIIEHIGPVGGSNLVQLDAPRLPAPQTGFRITVIAWGQEAVTRHVVQSHVILPL